MTRKEIEHYICPVCGYNQLPYPPTSWNICPCCGTEFENDDYNRTHQELRRSWIDAGMKWWSKTTRPPKNWNPLKQLESRGY